MLGVNTKAEIRVSTSEAGLLTGFNKGIVFACDYTNNRYGIHQFDRSTPSDVELIRIVDGGMLITFVNPQGTVQVTPAGSYQYIVIGK